MPSIYELQDTLKVGQRVRIKSKKFFNAHKNIPFGVTFEMSCLEGLVFTISKISPTLYGTYLYNDKECYLLIIKLKEDDMCWNWNVLMFEDVVDIQYVDIKELL